MFFFFKQKTAYEMRISDWSSDVCSSDLAAGAVVAQGAQHVELAIAQGVVLRRLVRIVLGLEQRGLRGAAGGGPAEPVVARAQNKRAIAAPLRTRFAGDGAGERGQDRKSTRLNSRTYCAHRMPSAD